MPHGSSSMGNQAGRIAGACTLMVLLLGGGAGAQESPAGRKSLCFRGAPRSECAVFAITEVAVGYWIPASALPDPYRTFSDHLAFSGDFGAMVNLGDRAAVGALVASGWTGKPYLALKPRIRFWLSPGTALDVSPGFTVMNEGVDAPRVGLDVSVMARDRIGLTGQAMEMTDIACIEAEWPDGCSYTYDWRLYLGVRAGSDVGAWGAGLGGLGLLALVLMMMAAEPS